MIKKVIKYTDFNGVEREEEFYFSISKSELTEWELSIDGGLSAYINKIVNTKSSPELCKMFKELILRSYGEKTIDGKRFVKFASDGHRLADDFVQTPAYDELFMSLLQDADTAAAFVNGIVPADVLQAQQKAIPATK